MSQTRVDSVLALTGFPPLVRNVPANWPTVPQVDKISLLWQYNYHDIYHKFSPYTNYNYNLLGGLLSNQQPFVYTYIDEKDKGIITGLPSIAKSVLSIVNVSQDTFNDVVRVAKWQVSSWGVQWLGTQFLIQRLQPFDETRIYNPLSVLLSTVQPMTIGLLGRPTRHIETNIAGLINAAGLGNFIPSAGYTKPASAAPASALSDYNTGQGKGLLRGGDAKIADANFSKAFPTPSTGGIGGKISKGIISSLKGAIGQIFGSAPSQPPGTIYRADEASYGIMAISDRLNVSQPWYPNPITQADLPPQRTTLLTQATNLVNSVISIVSNPMALIGKGITALFPSTAGNHYSTFLRQKIYAVPGGFLPVNISKGYNGPSIKGRGVGYTINNNSKYGNVIGITKDGDFHNSDMMVQFGYYADSTKKYDSKFADTLSPDGKVDRVSNTLKDVINKIGSQDTEYIVKTSTYSKLLLSGDNSSIGYNPLFDNVPTTLSPVGTYGSLKEYSTGTDIKGGRNNNVRRLPSTLDKRVNANKNLKFATTFTSDGLNQLPVLKANNDGTIPIPYKYGLSKQHANWTKYKPYEDDLIAFFFYDVVNQKYIPFRATVKGISEGNTAFWDELRFLGRADQLYSYNGFSRTLSFSFNIVINSITELLPSWKKINYLASATKPSNYTKSDNLNDVYNRFIVPPMFMITIGDLYRFQPIVLRSITVNIPEDALWETLNQYNSDEWNYLNGIIKAQSTGIDSYGQLPREAEISVEGALLEKERAQVGGSHFGHAPKVDNWENFVDSDGNPLPSAFVVGTSGTDSSIFMPEPSYLHKNIIESNPSYNPVKQPTPSTPAPVTTTTQGPTTAGNQNGQINTKASNAISNISNRATGVTNPTIPSSIGPLTDFTTRIPGL